MIKINPNAKVAYRRSGWPFIEHSTFMDLPLISKGIIKSRAISVQLNFTQKSDTDISVTSCELNEKALSGQPNVLLTKADLEQESKKIMENNDFTATNLCKKIWLDQTRGAGYFLSKHEIKFRSRRWGSSLPVCARLTFPLVPPSTRAEIFRRTCLQSHL